MNAPLELKIDYKANASYVRYRQLPPGEHVARTDEVLEDGAVAVDLDAQGNILGIELLGFSPDVIGAAMSYAKTHDLTFPRELTDSPGMPVVAPSGDIYIVEAKRPGSFVANNPGSFKMFTQGFTVISRFFRKPGTRV